MGGCRSAPVSVPYEITLLSNVIFNVSVMNRVSVPYEITLLSNGSFYSLFFITVSVPYEITLLSNHVRSFTSKDKFQYLMKLHYSQT